MGKRINFKFRVMVIGISLFVLLTVTICHNHSANALDLVEVPYNSTDVISEYELKDYTISRERVNLDTKYIVTEKSNPQKSYSMELDALNEGTNGYNITNIKADKNRNVIYYIKKINIEVYEIVEKSIDTFDEKTIYKSKDYSEKIKLFGITIWQSSDSIITKSANLINDYLIVNNALILIKNQYVTIFDGYSERVIIDESVKAVSNCGNYIYYTNEVGELFYMKSDDFQPHKIEGVNTDEITGTDRGVHFVNRLDNNNLYYYDIESKNIIKR